MACLPTTCQPVSPTSRGEPPPRQLGSELLNVLMTECLESAFSLSFQSQPMRYLPLFDFKFP
jgi:hypothetical protein